VNVIGDKKMNKNTLARNIVLLEELEKVLKKFEEENIEVILLKGCSLLGRIYTDEVITSFSKREMEDLDLLIQKKDSSRIKEILERFGYQFVPAGDLTFVKKYGENFPPVVLDLQEKIWYIRDTKKIWENALTVENAGIETKVLSPEEEIIFLAAHRVVHHGKINESCLLDVRKIIEHYQEKISWEKIVEKIKNYALETPLYFVFSKVENIPFWVRTEIKPRNSFSEKLYQLFFSFSEYEDIGHFLRLLTFPTLFGKINFLFNFFFPGKEFLIRRYGLKNKFFALLFYFLRPFILLFKGLKLSLILFTNLLIHQFTNSLSSAREYL